MHSRPVQPKAPAQTTPVSSRDPVHKAQRKTKPSANQTPTQEPGTKTKAFRPTQIEPTNVPAPLPVDLEDGPAVPVTGVELDLDLRPHFRLVSRRDHALPRRRHRLRLSLLRLRGAPGPVAAIRDRRAPPAAGHRDGVVRAGAVVAFSIFRRVVASVSGAVPRFVRKKNEGRGWRTSTQKLVTTRRRLFCGRVDEDASGNLERCSGLKVSNQSTLMLNGDHSLSL